MTTRIAARLVGAVQSLLFGFGSLQRIQFAAPWRSSRAGRC